MKGAFPYNLVSALAWRYTEGGHGSGRTKANPTTAEPQPRERLAKQAAQGQTHSPAVAYFSMRTSCSPGLCEARLEAKQ